jgi:hypothetical protein
MPPVTWLLPTTPHFLKVHPLPSGAWDWGPSL